MSTEGRDVAGSFPGESSDGALAPTGLSLGQSDEQSRSSRALDVTQLGADDADDDDAEARLVQGDLIGDGNRFEIIERLGAGGMGMVYRALDRQLNRVIAIKFVLPARRRATAEMVEMLRREARATAQLNHENIVRIFDLGTWQGHPFLVIEHMEGESLQSLLDRGRLPPERAIEIVIDVARGLEHAHWRGIIHRDL